MARFLAIAFAGLLAASGCGSTPGPNPAVQAPPSAQSIAESSSDFSGMQKCPESGAYDNYLKAEQTKAPDQYAKDSKAWNDVKASGANDGYIVVYAANATDCGHFGATTPSGKAANVYAFRFKDTSSASASYKAQLSNFHLSDTDVANIKAAGGTVQQGAATGLGENSIVVTIDVLGTTVYVALWQDKEFEVAVLVFNLPLADGKAVATKINGRIR